MISNLVLSIFYLIVCDLNLTLVVEIHKESKKIQGVNIMFYYFSFLNLDLYLFIIF